MTNKRCKAIDLNFIYSYEGFWSEYPDSFEPYNRYSASFENKIAEVSNKKEVYQNLGFSSLAKEANEDLESIKQLSEMHHGYHQIKSPTAAVILAKILNFCFRQDGIFLNNDSTLLNYCPFICPFNETTNFFPSEIVDKINLLDSLPESEGNPIFDFFALIVPTFYNGDMFTEKHYKNILSFYVTNKIFKSILVGEKNNKFHFIDIVF
jgi:hypothetical protein